MIPRLLIPLWCLFQAALAIRTNVTIDDSSPDPQTGKSIVYSPASAWNSGTICQRGPGKCTAAPNKGDLNAGTWHESTFNPTGSSSNDFPNTPLTASVQFDGTAVYVFCALALTTSGPSGNSDMTFIIDGKVVGNFIRPAPNSPGYDYNFPVYSNDLLSPGPHELHVVNGRVNGTKSLIMIDRIVYTFETDPTPSPSTPPSTPTNHIAGPASSSGVTPSSSIISSHPASPSSSSPGATASLPSPSKNFGLPGTSVPPTLTGQPSQSQVGASGGDQTHSQIPPGTIVGAVLGSLTCALLMVAAFVFGRRWWRERPRPVALVHLASSPPPYTLPNTFLNQVPISTSQDFSNTESRSNLTDRPRALYR